MVGSSSVAGIVMVKQEIWIDMNLPATMKNWFSDLSGYPCLHFADLGFEVESDVAVLDRARGMGTIILTKDRDFADLISVRGAPPQVVWLRIGNATNRRLRLLVSPLVPRIVRFIESGAHLIEVAPVHNRS
jgi:predicted nuclease of predicted toxin-antitoxin system